MFRQRTVFLYKTCLEETGKNETLEIASKLVNAGSSIQRTQAGADKASLLQLSLYCFLLLQQNRIDIGLRHRANFTLFNLVIHLLSQIFCC